MENKYMNVAARPMAPQMNMNQHAMMRQNMQCLAWGQQAAPEPVKAKATVGEKVKKWGPIVAIAGFAGYSAYKNQESTPDQPRGPPTRA